MLKFRGGLAGFGLAVIYNLPEAEVARILRESLIFLNFGTAEGSPLPPAEAMASACLVIGYDGRGGREFITPEYAFPIETGDVVSFAATVERVIRELGTNPQPLREKARRASEYILQTYTPQREEIDILAAWSHLAGVTLESARPEP
jgi:glycosyltransferase involved in cell wall biosynthesis